MEYVTKFSNISVKDCKKHLNIEEDFIEEDNFISVCLLSAKDYILNYTELTIEELDKVPSINIATLLLVSHFYECRSVVNVDNRLNFILKSILNMYKKWM